MTSNVRRWCSACAALAQGAGLEMSSHLFAEASVQLLAVTPTCHWLEYVDWADPILAGHEIRLFQAEPRLTDSTAVAYAEAQDWVNG